MEKERKFIAPINIGDYCKKGDIFIVFNEGLYVQENNSNGGRELIQKQIVETYFEEYVEPKKKITIDDIVIGKTVLISSVHKYEYLVTGKQNESIIVSWLGFKTIEDVNEHFIIKE